jgi:hypothetical protein
MEAIQMTMHSLPRTQPPGLIPEPVIRVYESPHYRIARIMNKHFNLVLESNDLLSVLQPAIRHAIQILLVYLFWPRRLQPLPSPCK